MHTVFGIRHHGPGSARSLRIALEQLQPDIVLIEGPPDADDMIKHVANEDLIPPVALLLYNPKILSQAAYYPFAEFSPEWQAMKYALEKEIAVQFMDLPQAMHFGLAQAAEENTQLQFELPAKDTPPISYLQKNILRDPIGYMANLAGYEDSERWWEITFEQGEGHLGVFPIILEMMTALREDMEAYIPTRELQREAYMRKVIRAAQKSGHQNIAIVCGAWHAPVLHNLKAYKNASDNALLKGIKKIKPKNTWIPWTYDRLARKSGYGAGVVSPAWYALLFKQRRQVVTRWMSQAAQLLREADIPASSAHVIEAVRLAETLAAIRELSIPGIQELYEAAVTILGEGHASKIDFIKDKLIVGDRIGQVPDSIPVVPLQQDLEKTIKTARLSKEYKSTDAIDKKLDLRKDTNLLASRLLHRLNILNINWGLLLENSQHNTGSFSETWKLKWLPDFAITIIEAGTWGNTVYAASVFFILKKANEIRHLPLLTPLIEKSLKADLEAAIPHLVIRLQEVSALTKDTFHLMEALLPLVNVIRYGSTRKMDIKAVEQIVSEMIPRICIGLPNACTSIDEDVASELFKKLQATNRAINILNDKIYSQQWDKVLQQLANDKGIHPLVQASSTRVLFDKNIYDIPTAAKMMQFALSNNEKQAAAYWIEGFLNGSGLLLIHNPKLWQIIDDWVNELAMDNIQEILPLLRRTFAQFSELERQKMLQLAQSERQPSSGLDHEINTTIEDLNMERARQVLPTLQLLLGK